MTEPQKAQPTAFQRYRRLWPFFKPARGVALLGIIAGVAFAGLSGVGLPTMLKYVLPIFFGKENEAHPKVIEYGRQWFGENYQEPLLLVACLALPVLFLLRGLAAMANRYWTNEAGFIFLEHLRLAVFSRLQQLPLAFFQRHKSGDLVSRLVSDCEQLKKLVLVISNDLIKQPLTMIGSAYFLIKLSIEERSAMVTMIALAGVPICVVPIRIITRRLIKRSRAVAAQSGQLAATVTETLQSPLEVQAYNLQKKQTEAFTERVREILRLSMKTVKYQALLTPTIEFITACGLSLAIYFGVRAGMDFSTFSAMGLALFFAYEPFKKLSNVHSLIKTGQASMERLEEILDAEDTVPNPAQPKPLPSAPGEITFEKVSFFYPNRTGESPPALADVNLKIHRNDIVALVGASGAGKSTFTLLISRFFDPTSGRVLAGGTDLRDLDKNALRSQIAIVPQMPVLFNASVADNIRVGRENATDAEVQAAAQQAFIHEFVTGLPQGYDTMVGERGALLSGGQRQRIAIARAFLKDAPMLILDEATSALDSESEAKIHDALTKLVAGRTTLMIAHHFRSLSLANRILVFEEGRITGDGTPEELAQSHPVYRRMCELQRLE
jgi:ATP-binding cassette, subfamily B, bacterial MsbA